MSRHFHPLRVKEIKKETNKTVSIVFEVPESLKEEFKYESGQYLNLKKEIGGEDIRRSYSISSCLGVDNDIQVSSKVINGGKMSSYLFNDLGVGDQLEVMPPDGNFTLKNYDQALVLFAAGSGITPIFSILKDALFNGNQTVHLYYGNRTEEDIIFHNQLKELREQYPNRLLVQHYLSSNGERIDLERTKNIVSSLKNAKNEAQYFICGPAEMIASVKEGLEACSIDKEKINVEYFASPKTDKKVPEEVVSGNISDIQVIIDGEEYGITLKPGEAILDGASRIGVDPPFSCQSGVCTTCKAKVLSGKVEMENNFGLGEDEIEEGFVLTCIGTPSSAGVKISWDDE